MHDCNSCGGCSDCGGCGGCAGSLTLTPGELHLLQKLAQLAFLPVARSASDPKPVYLEDQEQTREQYSLILICLEKKGLIVIDFDRPLRGADMSAYTGYPIHGSIALTARGQDVLDILEKQGAN